MTATPTAASYPQWETDLLKSLGVTPTAGNLEALNLWASSENTPAKGNNPLAITDPSNKYPHSGIIATNGGDPVYAFPSEAVGVAATASFLQHGYQGIIQGLAGGTLADVWSAINKSTWCSGCQGGKYPTVIYSALGGNAPATIFQGGSGSIKDPVGSSTTGSGSNAITSVGCNSTGGVGILGAHFGTQCQIKAITGGLLTGFGAIIMLVGAYAMIKDVSVAEATKRAVSVGGGRQAPKAQAVSGPPQSLPPSSKPKDNGRGDLNRREDRHYRKVEKTATPSTPADRARYNRHMQGDAPVRHRRPVGGPGRKLETAPSDF